MGNEILSKRPNEDLRHYEDEIEIRGCKLSLSQIKSAYREFQALVDSEATKIIPKLGRPEGMSDEELEDRNSRIRKRAFRVTISIIGFDGQTAYDDDETLFDSPNLPTPIRTVFFTNTTAWQNEAPNSLPPNRFSAWLNFHKPPVIDPNPLVSDPTPNESKVQITADDIGFFRAVQTIVAAKLKPKKNWYYFLHEKFTYDVGLWIVLMPFSLYWITIYMDRLFPSDGPNSAFRIPFYIYSLGISIIFYRSIYGYLKWAFPVNTLTENKDKAWLHRTFLGGLLLSLVGSSIWSAIEHFIG